MLGIIVRGILGVLLLALIVPALPRPHADAPASVPTSARGPSPSLPVDGGPVPAGPGAPIAPPAEPARNPLSVIGSTVSYAAHFCTREPRPCANGLDALSTIGDRIRGPLISAVYALFGGSTTEPARTAAPAPTVAVAPVTPPNPQTVPMGTLNAADRALPWQPPGADAVR